MARFVQIAVAPGFQLGFDDDGVAEFERPQMYALDSDGIVWIRETWPAEHWEYFGECPAVEESAAKPTP